MKFLRHSTLSLLLVLASLLPAEEQARLYQAIGADVPFKFTVGERSFAPGHYDFILVGAGLIAVRDHHRHLVASLVTRSSEEAKPSQRTRLVFDRSKKKARLEKIYVESRAEVLEVVGEQLALRSTPAPEPLLPMGTFSFSQRDGAVLLRH